MTNEQDSIWTAAFRLLEIPAAITEGDGDGLRILISNPMFRELLAGTPEEQARKLAPHAAETNYFALPEQPGWLMRRRPLEGESSHVLWQARRRTPEDVSEGIAAWVASATLGDMAIMYFDSDRRLRAYNAAIRKYFPPAEAFPRLGATFAEQLDGIISHYDFGPLRGREEQWRQDLLAGFDDPGRPKLGLTPSGRWALATTTRLGDGSSIHLLNDVTAFRERDQQMKLYMRNAKGIMFSRRNLDEDGELRVWGDANALRLAGNPTDDLVEEKDTSDQQSWFQLIDPRDVDRYVSFMAARKPGDKPYSIEFRFRHPDTGEVRWISETGWTVTDIEGRNYLDAIYFDITENKLTTEALRESEKRFRDFTELASDWYFETDSELRITYISERYETISGTAPQELVGLPWINVIERRISEIDPADAKPWWDLFETWQRHEPFRDVELKLRNTRGEMVYARISGEPQFDEDGVFLGYRGIGRDVTALTQAQNRALKSLEHAEQANAAKSAFIANVSHELRTPLNAILGFSAIMSQQMLGPIGNERYRAYAEDIAASGQHLLSLVNDLLDISKVEAGRYSIDDEEVDVETEIESVIHLLGDGLAGKELVRAFGEGPHLLRADQRAVRQMLINLIGNAVKYTGDDGRITIDIARTAQGQPVVEIADNGVGIPADDLARVMEPFGRVRSEIAAEGTGLGLPLTRRLMELHGGVLQIHSKPGEGTSVRMVFPADRNVPLPDGRRRGAAAG